MKSLFLFFSVTAALYLTSSRLLSMTLDEIKDDAKKTTSKRSHQNQGPIANPTTDPTMTEDVKKKLKLAEGGNAEAQVSLANAYRKGNGVKQDLEKAFTWALKAAQQGHLKAQFYVGVALHKGFGVPKDDKQGLAWIKEAAKQNPEAQAYLDKEFPSKSTGSSSAGSTNAAPSSSSSTMAGPSSNPSPPPLEIVPPSGDEVATQLVFRRKVNATGPYWTQQRNLAIISRGRAWEPRVVTDYTEREFKPSAKFPKLPLTCTLRWGDVVYERGKACLIQRYVLNSPGFPCFKDDVISFSHKVNDGNQYEYRNGKFVRVTYPPVSDALKAYFPASKEDPTGGIGYLIRSYAGVLVPSVEDVYEHMYLCNDFGACQEFTATKEDMVAELRRNRFTTIQGHDWFVSNPISCVPRRSGFAVDNEDFLSERGVYRIEDMDLHSLGETLAVDEEEDTEENNVFRQRFELVLTGNSVSQGCVIYFCLYLPDICRRGYTYNEEQGMFIPE